MQKDFRVGLGGNMYFLRAKNDFIYEQYDKYTPVLKTIEDYEQELKRAKEEYKLFYDTYWLPKLHRWSYDIPHGMTYINFLICRIDNCYIRINQLKNKKFAKK